MPCYTLAELAEEIQNCGQPANRSDVIRILHELNVDICSLQDIISRRQRNKNNALTTFVANVENDFELSDVTVFEIPSGSLVGDTIEIQYDGLYRVDYNVTFITNAIANQLLTVNVKLNGAIDFSNTALSSLLNTNISDYRYKRYVAGDIISVHGISATTNRNANLVFDVEYLVP